MCAISKGCDGLKYMEVKENKEDDEVKKED